MKGVMMQTALAAVAALLFLTTSAVAEEWTSVVVNHEEQFTDGGGMQRKGNVRDVLFRTKTLSASGKMGNFEIQDLMFRVEIDGKERTVIYSLVSRNQVNVTVLGSTEAEQISLNYTKVELLNNGNVAQWTKGATWIMAYNGVRLYGTVGGGAQGTTVGTDPISFAALSFNPLASPAVVRAIKEGEGTTTQSAIKLFGGIFGPKIGGGARCYKKKVTTISCTAQCVQTAEGCPCECMGIPCCSECQKVEETVWEYSVGGQLG